MHASKIAVSAAAVAGACLTPLTARGVAVAHVAIPLDSAKAIALSHQFDLYWLIGQLLALLIPAGLLFTGAAARMQARCQQLTRHRRHASLALFASAYLSVNALLRLPFDYLRHYRLPKSLGRLGDQTPAGWLLQQELLPLLVLMAGAVLFLWIPYAWIRRSPRHWWLWSAIAMTGCALFVLIVQPVWIQPLTAHYTPLTDQRLRHDIDALARRCGLADVPIVVGGDDTSVLGLGPTRRIILQQDLSTQETPAQVRFTIGHELKHYVLDDNWKALGIAALLFLLGFCAVHHLGSWALSRWHHRFGFRRLEEPASLPIFVLCLTALWLAATPAFLAFDRHVEAEADRFGLELTHENDAAAVMFARWADENERVEPDWFERTFRATHPSIAERIRMADTYRPWATGAPLRYGTSCAMPR